jgi:hypothetical protein
MSLHEMNFQISQRFFCAMQSFQKIFFTVETEMQEERNQLH